jgi:type II secretory pathway pseudopilin PulG
MNAAFRLTDRCNSRTCRPQGRQAGAVLLEVVLALVLFVSAATVLTSGLSSSLDAVERLRLSTHAANLAVTVISELQLGTRTLAGNGPQPFETPFEQWTWEAVATPLQGEYDENKQFNTVEVIIRHAESPIVYRLSQVLSAEQGSKAEPLDAAMADDF